MWATVAVVSVVCAGCAADRPDGATSGLGLAAARAVHVDTSGCGDAGPVAASGVLLAPDLVVTAAHVVADGDGTAIVTLRSDPDVDAGGPAPATASPGVTAEGRPSSVIAVDTRADLALLRLAEPVQILLPELALADLAGEQPPTPARMIGGRTSGDVAGTVLRRVNIEIDEVRSNATARRLGHELRLPSARGDSGAGVYVTGADGPELLGLLFASGAEARSWTVASQELDALARRVADGDVQLFRCDAAASRLVEIEP